MQTLRTVAPCIFFAILLSACSKPADEPVPDPAPEPQVEPAAVVEETPLERAARLELDTGYSPPPGVPVDFR